MPGIETTLIMNSRRMQNRMGLFSTATKLFV